MSQVKFAGRIHTPIQIYHLHSHPYWEVVCYTQGIGTVEIDGNIVSFETGDIFFLPPGSIHSDHADDGFKNIHYEFEDASFPYHTWIKIRDTDAGDFLSVITRLYNEYQLKRKNYAEIVDSLHDVLLHYLIAFSDQATHHPCVETAINQIVTNFSDPFYDLSQIMTHIHLNPDYFRKLSKKAMGISPLTSHKSEFLMPNVFCALNIGQACPFKKSHGFQAFRTAYISPACLKKVPVYHRRIGNEFFMV